MIEQDQAIDRLRDDLDERVIELIARQAPVATDLRTLVTSLRISADLERMGDLALHIAKLALLRYPVSAVPAELRATLLEMGQVAQRNAATAGGVIASRDVAQALQLERDDDEMDRLHRELLKDRGTPA